MCDKRKDYPEVVFNLLGWDDLTPEEQQVQVEQVIRKLHASYKKMGLATGEDENVPSGTVIDQERYDKWMALEKLKAELYYGDEAYMDSAAVEAHASHIDEIRYLEAQFASKRAEAEKKKAEIEALFAKHVRHVEEAEKERAEMEARHARNLETEKRMQDETEKKKAEIEALLAKHTAMLERMGIRPQDDAK